MTRTRNATFVGSSVLDVDTDAPMYTRTLANAAADYHLLYDAVTGENAIASPLMTHNGAGLGSPLGLSMVSQGINKKLGFSSTDIGTYNQSNIIMWGAMVRIPGGETRNLQIAVDMDPINGSQSFWAELYDTSAALVGNCSITGPFSVYGGNGGGPSLYQGIIPHSTGGVWRMLLIRTVIPDDSPGWCQIRGVHVGPQIIPSTNSYNDGRVAGGTNLYPVKAVSAGEAVRSTSIHDSVIDQNGRVINGWVLTKMNQNLTGFHEFLTGSPVPGNASLTNSDTSATNPTTSRFSARTRNPLTAEPQVPFPLACEGLGAMGWDGSLLQPLVNSTATAGSINWFAPYPTATGTASGQTLGIYAPDFDYAAGVGNLVCKALVCETGASKLTNWQLRVSIGGGSATAWASPSYLGSSMFATVTMTGVPVSRDALNTITLQSQKTLGAYAFGEFFVLGWTLAYDT